MINYSIVLRSVNTNLLEINQAKSRVAKAKKDGVDPVPADVELANTAIVTKAYAVAQYADIMDIAKLAKHISSHGCVYSRGDIAAILNMTVDCILEQLLEGKKIRLGELGDFSISIESKGAETADKFNPAAHITGINVIWDCGEEFKNLLPEAEFNLVASRKAQAAVLKAIKKGETVVDLSNPEDDTPLNPGGTPVKPGQEQTVKKTITASASPSNGGTVTGGGSYAVGEQVTLNASPASGYSFSKWDDGNTSPSRQITVAEDKTYRAIFVSTAIGDEDEGH